MADKPKAAKSGGQEPSIGRIVHFVLGGDSRNPRAVRPGIIVALNAPDSVNLQVFTDGRNDGGVGFDTGVSWRTSVPYDGDDPPAADTWHWPPRS